jgi:hypothetical protein
VHGRPGPVPVAVAERATGIEPAFSAANPVAACVQLWPRPTRWPQCAFTSLGMKLIYEPDSRWLTVTPEPIELDEVRVGGQTGSAPVLGRAGSLTGSLRRSAEEAKRITAVPAATPDPIPYRLRPVQCRMDMPSGGYPRTVATDAIRHGRAFRSPTFAAVHRRSASDLDQLIDLGSVRKKSATSPQTISRSHQQPTSSDPALAQQIQGLQRSERAFAA